MFYGACHPNGLMTGGDRDRSGIYRRLLTGLPLSLTALIGL